MLQQKIVDVLQNQIAIQQQFRNIWMPAEAITDAMEQVTGNDFKWIYVSAALTWMFSSCAINSPYKFTNDDSGDSFVVYTHSSTVQKKREATHQPRILLLV
jgi:hypothetical protein